MDKKWLGLLVMIMVLLIPVSTTASQSMSSPSDHGQMYLLVINNLSVSDINKIDTPGIENLVRHGALGLASNRTLRSSNSNDISLTIGAGNVARAYNNGILGFNRDEVVPTRNIPANHMYENLSGMKSNDSSILMVNLPEVIVRMKEEKVNTVPGSLGEILGDNEIKICMLGNGDINEKYYRSTVAIGMDANGQVLLGDVGSRTVSKTNSFLGWETNYHYLSEQVKLYANKADLIIMDLSDLARLEKAGTPYPEVGQKQKQLYLHKIDQFVQQIVKQINPYRDQLMIISASPAQEQIKNKNTFTPVIMYGAGISPNSILTSGTTRRNYIVANTDIAPTILNYFGIADVHQNMIGQPMINKPVNYNTLTKANDFSNSAATVNRLRAPLVKGYVVLLIVILVLGIIAIFWLPRLVPIIQPFVVGLVTFPLVLLPLGKIPLASDSMYILAAILFTIAITYFLYLFYKKDGLKAFMVLSIITVGAINMDLLTGAHMIASSVMGYDAMTGARYYGIGNEYGGILIGSTIIITALVFEKFGKRWILGLLGLAMLAECYIIAGPSFGASSDGALTAPAAYLVTLTLLGEVKISPKALVSMLGIILAAVLGLSIYDMNRPPELQTHIGRAANQIKLGGWQEGLIIISRKLAMNMKLIRYTIWSRVFLTMLGVLALLVYRPVGAMEKLRRQHPAIIKAFAGIITAAIIGLIINDSGIVAAATTSIYMAVPMLLLMLNLQKEENYQTLLSS